MKVTCDRCNLSIKYKGDYLFNDGQFFGDNGDRILFKLNEVICSHCIEELARVGDPHVRVQP